jgi:hypothetical protein
MYKWTWSIFLQNYLKPWGWFLLEIKLRGHSKIWKNIRAKIHCICSSWVWEYYSFAWLPSKSENHAVETMSCIAFLQQLGACIHAPATRRTKIRPPPVLAVVRAACRSLACRFVDGKGSAVERFLGLKHNIYIIEEDITWCSRWIWFIYC